MKYIININIQGTTTIGDDLNSIGTNEREERKSQHLISRLNIFVPSLPFTFKEGVYEITIKDIKIEGNGVGVWYYAKRNNNFVAAHSPIWVYNIPLLIEVSSTLDSDVGNVKTYTKTLKEDIIQNWIEGMIRNLDACELGDPIGDDVADIYGTYGGEMDIEGVNESLAAIRAETTATTYDMTYNICFGTLSCSATTNQYNEIERFGMSFLTTPMSGKLISAVVHYMYCVDAGTSWLNPTGNFETFTPSSDTSYVAADYDNTDNTKLSDSNLVFGTNPTDTDQWCSLSYNATGMALIDKAGYTTIYYRHNADQGSVSPGWSNNAVSFMGFNAPHLGTNVPYLHITFSVFPIITKTLSYTIAKPLTNFHAQRDGTHIDVTWS